MAMTRRRFIGGLAVGGTLAVAGCLGGDGNTIELHETWFDPSVLWVDPGDEVTFEHVDGVHSVTLFHEDNGVPHRAPAGATAFDEPLSAGSLERTFDVEGVHGIFCRPHEAAGMATAVVVGDYDEGEPGLAEPQAALPAAMRDRLSAIVTEVLEGEPADDGPTGPY